MADFLSGISVGAHKGLADLVTSKRANRQMAREQGRYENQLALQLGSAASARRDRDRTFAYQQTRDDVRDKQWAKGMGLREDELDLGQDRFAETKRSNKARETLASETAERQGEQFDERMQHDWELYNLRETTHEDNLAAQIRSEKESSRQSDETTEQKWDIHHENLEQEDARLAAQVNRDATTKQYYTDLIDLQRQRLNPQLSEEERRKIEVEIKRIEAQTGLYEAQTKNVGRNTRTTPKPTWMQAGDHARTFAPEYAKRFADRGRSFTWKPWGSIMKPGPQMKLPLTESTPFPYDEASGGQPGEPTQVSVVQEMGAEVFERMWRETGEVNLALQRMDTFYDAMLNDEEYGGTLRNYMNHYGPDNAEQELRLYFLKGGLKAAGFDPNKLDELMNSGTSPSEQIPVAPRF